MTTGGPHRVTRTSSILRSVFLCAAAIVGALALAGQPARAADIFLVGNLTAVGKSPSPFSYPGTPSAFWAQSFVTDENYTDLTSVVLSLSAGAANAEVSLVPDPLPSDGIFGTIYAQDNTESCAAEICTFDLPHALQPNTKYWIVLKATDTATEIDWDFDSDFSGFYDTWPDSNGTSPSIPYDDAAAIYDGSDLTLLLRDFGIQIFEVYVDDTTAVELFDFTATWSDGAARIAWRTGSETDNAGFHLWRADAADGAYVRITTGLIPAEGGGALGAAYARVDADVVPGAPYWYRLEDVDLDGAGTFHGPVPLLAGRIFALAPADTTLRTRRSARFTWEGTSCERFQVQFSRSANFGARTISLPGTASVGAGGSAWLETSAYRPSPVEWRRLKRLAGRSGRLYWRVVGTDAGGESLVSVPRRIRVR